MHNMRKGQTCAKGREDFLHTSRLSAPVETQEVKWLEGVQSDQNCRLARRVYHHNCV